MKNILKHLELFHGIQIKLRTCVSFKIYTGVQISNTGIKNLSNLINLTQKTNVEKNLNDMNLVILKGRLKTIRRLYSEHL